MILIFPSTFFLSSAPIQKPNIPLILESFLSPFSIQISSRPIPSFFSLSLSFFFFPPSLSANRSSFPLCKSMFLQTDEEIEDAPSLQTSFRSLSALSLRFFFLFPLCKIDVPSLQTSLFVNR